MANQTKELFLKYSIPGLAIIVIAVQFFYMNTQNLNAWKGGGFGMYTQIHYYYNQLHIPGVSVDSLVKDNREMKDVLGYLKLMPNDETLKKAAQLVLKTTDKDSIHIQVWKPSINSENGNYSRVLINEIHLKKAEF